MSKETSGKDTGYPIIGDTESGELTFTCKPHGRDPRTCEECAEIERGLFALPGATVYNGYVNDDHTRIETFGGFELARITSWRRGTRQYTPSGGSYRMAYVTVAAPNGSAWHGSFNEDSGSLVTLRRNKDKES